jgi:hypothetical protein
MKRKPMGSEREQDDWLGRTLRQTPASAPDACLDAETLAAWSDGGLSATAVAVVELHASNCSRCTAVLAEMVRIAPAASATPVWTLARIFRWAAPLAAAAAALAIWVAVPHRPIAPVEQARAARDLTAPERETPNLESGTPSLEPRTPAENLATSKRNIEPPVRYAPSGRVDAPVAEEVQMRDYLRRESAKPQALGAANDSAATAAPAAAPAPALPADALAVSAAKAQRSAFNSTGMSIESISPSSPLIHWRIVAPGSIERSTDGGKTWTSTSSPPSLVAGVRAVDGDRAVSRTSDGAEFFTTNGGLSWTRVQENSAAPF